MEIKKLQEIYLKPKSLPNEVKIKVAKEIKQKKIQLKNIFSNGDDYQILFTASKKMRRLIKKISKSTSTKVSIVGIVKNKSIYKNAKLTEEKFNFPKKLGYIHNF